MPLSRKILAQSAILPHQAPLEMRISIPDMYLGANSIQALHLSICRLISCIYFPKLYLYRLSVSVCNNRITHSLGVDHYERPQMVVNRDRIHLILLTQTISS